MAGSKTVDVGASIQFRPGETVDVNIGTGGAFIRFRRATDRDRKNFDAWLTNERDEHRESPETPPAEFKPQNDRRTAARWWLLQHCAVELFVSFSDNFDNDKSIIELLALAGAGAPAKASAAGMIQLLLTIPAIADVVQKAIGVSFDSVLDFLAPQQRN